MKHSSAAAVEKGSTHYQETRKEVRRCSRGERVTAAPPRLVQRQRQRGNPKERKRRVQKSIRDTEEEIDGRARRFTLMRPLAAAD